LVAGAKCTEQNRGEKQNSLKYGDLIFTTSSETIEEVGMTSVYLEKFGTHYLVAP